MSDPADRFRSSLKNIRRSAVVSNVDMEAVIQANRLLAGEEPGNVDDPHSPRLSVAAFQSSI